MSDPARDGPANGGNASIVDSVLPAKAYFRIGEVADLLGVEPHVLRYWEREFRSVRPTKSAKGQRVYSRRNVENLMRVRNLLYAEGFTIAGAKKKLQRSGLEPIAPAEEPSEAAASHPAMRGRAREQLLALRAEIAAFLEELGGSS